MEDVPDLGHHIHDVDFPIQIDIAARIKLYLAAVKI